jgi:small subunit ribosomal protein S20
LTLATHKSAAKRARQTVGKTARNSQTKGTVRTLEKKIRTALAAGDGKAAQSLLGEYTSKATRAATKGVIHMKSASRKIGRIAARIHTLTTAK